jgi:hypothetical protein
MTTSITTAGLQLLAPNAAIEYPETALAFASYRRFGVLSKLYLTNRTAYRIDLTRAAGGEERAVGDGARGSLASQPPTTESEMQAERRSIAQL